MDRPDILPAQIETKPSIGRVALLWRGDATAPPPDPGATRFHLIFSALGDVGLRPEPVLYAEGEEARIRERLLAVDGVLVWVNPLDAGRDRARLDSLLRDVAAHGVWVSAHPDVILKMGVKEVLYRTRRLGWGTDTDLYSSADDFSRRFPARLAASGPRVLKQNRGNGGQGVWKVELTADAGANPAPSAPIRVLHAERGSMPENVSLGSFMDLCLEYFRDGERIIDQAFQPRLPEGMIRCYVAQDEVVGFGHQLIKALVAPPESGEASPPGPRMMHGPDAPQFQQLRQQLHTEWLPAMQNLLDIPTASLPALWDADFLYGPKRPDGSDTYVLCEINVSSVAPYPDTAAAKVAKVALSRVRAARQRRT